MKICTKCGIRYTDDNMFCEMCGSKLMKQIQNSGMQEQWKLGGNVRGQVMRGQNEHNPNKLNSLLYVIPIVIIGLLLVLLLLFWDNLPVGKKGSAAQETVQQESSDAAKSDELKLDSGKEDAEKEGAQESEASYADADINGVDNAYVQVTGVVNKENGNFILKLQKASSVSAYNVEEDIIYKEETESFTLDGFDLEEYLGDTVEIKGKLSADFDGNISLHPVTTEIKQQEKKEAASNNRYQLIQADVTWEEAFLDCINRGGMLVRINSEEEFQKITELIEEQNMQNIHFYLGGRRDSDNKSYYWADADNCLEDELLNPQGQSWAADHWMANEPSFVSEGDMELYLNLIYYQENWVLNDVPLDITQYYPGKTGYICEFNE